MNTSTSTALHGEALETLRTGRRFLMCGHVKPDGDCIGAQAALARGLMGLGKEVHVVNPDHPGSHFEDLMAPLPFSVYAGGPLPEHDVCVLLDINELSRCGALEAPIRAAASKKLVIDHHPPGGDAWWDAAILDVSAAASGLIVWRVLHELGAPVDALVASAVFTSLVTDTGWFRYSNTDAETLSTAADLVRLGAEPAQAYRALFQHNPETEPQAVAEVLRRVEYFAGGTLAIVDQPSGADGEAAVTDTDLVLDALRSVKDVEVVLYLRQVAPERWKLSARSKNYCDVNLLARRFGGGGHARASGATIEGGLADIRKRLAEAAVEQLVAGRGAPGMEPAS